MAALSRYRWILLLVLGLAAESRAAGWPTEYAVKAAFLYHFARFVEWPATAANDRQRQFVLAILGQDPFGPLLDQTLNGSVVRERKIVIRRANRVEDCLDADMVFVSASEDPHLALILARLAGRSILTIGDSHRFAERGGMINLRVVQSRVTFDINPTAAAAVGLTISSQVLKLAHIVSRAS
jgi:hypothetical protein